MATPYNATINIAIATIPDYRVPAGLANLYGMWFTQGIAGGSRPLPLTQQVPGSCGGWRTV